MLLANPLPWQRYYLPLIPPVIVLSAVGVRYIFRLLLSRRMMKG
jgi:hypothetical protein